MNGLRLAVVAGKPQPTHPPGILSCFFPLLPGLARGQVITNRATAPTRSKVPGASEEIRAGAVHMAACQVLFLGSCSYLLLLDPTPSS